MQELKGWQHAISLLFRLKPRFQAWATRIGNPLNT
jgi:hypothetical protein